MRILLAAIFMMCTSIAFADVNLGQKVDFYAENGKPKFGVQMTTDLTALTFSINASDITKNKSVTKVSVRFVDKTTGEWLSDVISIADIPGGTMMVGTQAFTLSITGSDSKKVQSLLGKSAMLIGVKDGTVGIFSGYVDLGQYCSLSADHFLNLDTGAVGCPAANAQVGVPKISMCLGHIAATGGWQGKFSSELPCLNKNPEFLSGISYLCTKNQGDLSVQYKKYLDYESQVATAFKEFQAATDPGSRLLASQKLTDIKRDWQYYGFQNEVSQARAAVGSAHEACFSQK